MNFLSYILPFENIFSFFPTNANDKKIELKSDEDLQIYQTVFKKTDSIGYLIR
jgi:hypothetical protein